MAVKSGQPLGVQLRELREGRGLSLDKVVELTKGGISKTALTNIERDLRYPTVATLEILAEALGVSFQISPEATTIIDRGQG